LYNQNKVQKHANQQPRQNQRRGSLKRRKEKKREEKKRTEQKPTSWMVVNTRASPPPKDMMSEMSDKVPVS
jgi:hypothetical protein